MPKSKLPRRARGMPTKYKPEYCAAVVEYLSKGHSLVAFAGSIDVHPETVTNWRHLHPEFEASVLVGQSKAIEYYERALLSLVEGDEQASHRSQQAILFALRNRGRDAGWDDRQHVQLDGNGSLLKIEVNKRDPDSMSVDELQELINNTQRSRELLAVSTISNPSDRDDGQEQE